MSDLIQCPSCQRSLSVPDALIGRPVKCPDCGAVFLTVQGPGAPQAEAAVPSALPASQGAPAAAEPHVEPPRSTVIAPAIALLIIGALGFMGTFLNLLAPKNDPPVVFQGDPAMQEQLERWMKTAAGPVGTAFHGAFLAVNLLILTGGAAMLSGRFYGLAVLASALVMIDIECCCCLAGMPVGVWSLIVLMRPEVKALFQ